MDLLGGDAGNPDGLVPRGLPGEYGDIPARYLQELREELWDKQIEADAKAGRLDKLMEEAKQDFLAGRCKPLP